MSKRKRPQPKARRCSTPTCKKITMRERCRTCETAELLRRIAAKATA